MNQRSPVYQTGALTAKPQRQGVLPRVGLLATESVQSDHLCLSKVCQRCDLAQESRLEVLSLL